jgi:hypothetical protein
MTLSVVKEKLHNYIENADGRKLKAILALVEDDITVSNEIVDEATLKILDDRWDNYLSGKTKIYTIEQSFEKLKKNRKAIK